MLKSEAGGAVDTGGSSPSATTSAAIAERRRWMGLLARAPAAAVEAWWHDLADRPSYDRLRGPEQGLVMVRGRAGGSGSPFNLGEMTVTRCSVRLACGTIGHAYVAGRDARHVEIAAVCDALMQEPATREFVEEGLIAGLAAAEAARERRARARAAATKVDFFTMVRGDS